LVESNGEVVKWVRGKRSRFFRKEDVGGGERKKGGKLELPACEI